MPDVKPTTSVAKPKRSAAPTPAPVINATPQRGPSIMATTFAPAGADTANEQMQSMFGDVQSRAKTAMERGAKLVEEMNELTKGNVEAMMASGRVAAKGVESLGQGAAEYSKKSFESAAAAWKGMAAAKSPTELFKLQSDYARSSFDVAVAEGSRVSEAWLKLMGEIAQPLSTRIAVAAEKIKAPLA
jgi:phasin family protein